MSFWAIIFGSILVVLVWNKIEGHIEKKAYRKGYEEGREDQHRLSFSEGATKGYNKGYSAGLKRGRAESTLNLSKEQVKVLISLCHPDKHNNSQTATQMTQWLLTQRK